MVLKPDQLELIQDGEEEFGWRKARTESQWRIAWRMLRRNPMAMFGLIGLGVLVLAAIVAPLIAPYDPTAMDYESLLRSPCPAHLLGTDDLGRDILSRVLWGGRESLRVGLIGITIAMVGGTLIGLVSGYYGGLVDSVIMRITDVWLAFPAILLVLSIVAALGPNLGTVLVALSISAMPWFGRFVRGSVLAARNFEYITAAEVVGATDARIMFRHVLPNVLAPIVIYASLGLGNAIMITAGMSYIGLGAQPPSPEWGAMLNYGRNYLREAWWMSVFPGLAIFLAVVCVNLFGDGLRDALDPKLRV
ncbi:MAG TPA: ABC transporter permease [Anaerolineae bacterium]|nr:ABC transporter permease [Anaerolineae bacterium]